MWDFPLFPVQASTAASRVDLVYFILIGLSILFASAVFIIIIYFSIKYRRTADVDRSQPSFESKKLEFIWLFTPLMLGLAVFTWQAKLYFDLYSPPNDALDVYVVGKQWMWKIQHPDGQSEINELHVPVNQPVRLIMTSQDVIHSFYIPAFRIKQDVLPGRYTSIWFEATKPGRYHLFCAEYCGTDHSNMIGSVVVLEEAGYQEWLTQNPTGGVALTTGAAAGAEAGGSMASTGENLFNQLGCATCHQAEGTGLGPSLVGTFGEQVELTSGETVTADEEYIRESIVNPQAKIVAGYNPIMPTFEGQLNDEQLQQLVEYIKSLGTEQESEPE
jgi:cytochrome c oxidase subunit 2